MSTPIRTRDSASPVTSYAGPDSFLRRGSSPSALDDPSSGGVDTSRPNLIRPRQDERTGLTSRLMAAPPAVEQPTPNNNRHDSAANSQQTERTRLADDTRPKKTKAHINISSLNMKGRYTTSPELGRREKFNDILPMMGRRKLGMLALQETHFNADYVAELTARFGDKIHIEYSSIQGRQATRAAGVALVFYKPFTNVVGVDRQVIIPGRALVVAAPWHNNRTMNVLVGYAPNDTRESTEFWNTISTFFKQPINRSWKPDVCCFDANLVPAAIDRLPAHCDDQTAVEAMEQFLRECDLLDGWREENPETLGFTFTEFGQCPSHSRIDRIYVKRDKYPQSRNWEITFTTEDGVNTDHRRVSCEMTTAGTPEQGHGRYTIPPYIVSAPEISKIINTTGLNVQHKMTNMNPDERTETLNPQTMWAEWKATTSLLMRKAAKRRIPKVKKRILALEERLKTILNYTHMDEHEKQLLVTPIQAEISHLGGEVWKKRKNSAQANKDMLGDTNSKYYTRLIKGTKAREPVIMLKKPNTIPVEYEQNSERMAQMTRNYHEKLQDVGDQVNEEERERDTSNVLDREGRPKLSPRQSHDMEADIHRDEVTEALMNSTPLSGAGIDGWQYEILKTIHRKWDKADKEGKGDNMFDIIGTLTCLFNDIQSYGLTNDSKFAEGWMCPIFKKKDRTDMANYRPITLLNTDYKLFTKVLAVRMANVAPTIIHPDQAGFMRGRSITDQIKLAKMTIYHADETEQDGMIVLLDQEKAYDKIRHDYLWKTLEAANFPSRFTDTIKSLYSNAQTFVILNGETSTPFRVTRGVRQGDPLSCLLFNVAIEPLATMLRESTLEGYRIPGEIERLIVTLFADDTTVFLSKNDSVEELMDILNKWCHISGAKFNVSKTIVIPIGSLTHRTKLMNERRALDDTEMIPEGIHITEDGESSRSLGGWIGNNIDPMVPWDNNLKATENVFEKIERLHPSLQGKRVGIQTYGASRSQYLATAENMPRLAEQKFDKMARTFFWEHKKARVNKETLRLPLNQGGQNLVDIKLRNDAIHLVILKKFLGLDGPTPKWALILKDLMRHNRLVTYAACDKNILVDPFIQTWETNRMKLPPDMRRMFKVAKDYGLTLDGMCIAKDIQEDMPIFYHHAWRTGRPRDANGAACRCLQTNHRVITVKDALRALEELENDGQIDPPECEHPNRCETQLRSLLNVIDPKWDPRIPPLDHREREEPVNGIFPFHKERQRVRDVRDTYRIFSQGPDSRCPETFLITENQDARAEQNLYICTTRGIHGQAGVGLWLKTDDRRNAAIIAQPGFEDEFTLSLLGIQRILELIPSTTQIKIHFRSKNVVKELTGKLEGNEDDGWPDLNTRQRILTQEIIAELRLRKSRTYLLHDKDLRSPGTRGAEALAREAARLAATGEQPEPLPTQTITTAHCHGAKLRNLTQKSAYKRLKKEQKTEARRMTEINIERTKHDIGELNKVGPSTEEIWCSVRNPDTSKKSQTFRWRTMHDIHATGKFFLNTEYPERSECAECGVTESMEHIQLECQIPASKQVWDTLQTIWEATGETWPVLSYGILMGCGMAKPAKNGNRSRRAGLNRLFQKLVSEGTLLNWKLRNERRIEFEDDKDKWHNKKAIRTRLLRILESTYTIDIALTNKLKYGEKALPKDKVNATWITILKHEAYSPEELGARARDEHVGVLVGRGLRNALENILQGDPV